MSDFLMTDREWNELACIKTLLAKFDRSSQLLSMQRHPTIAAYIPTLNWLSDSLEQFISDNPGPMAEAAKKGLEKLQKYEAELSIQSSVIPYVGTFLNPALKLNYFKEQSSNRTYIKKTYRKQFPICLNETMRIKKKLVNQKPPLMKCLTNFSFTRSNVVKPTSSSRNSNNTLALPWLK